MKEYKHLGAYGIIIKNEEILLISKVSGPYDGKLDLPGGTIEFGERPSDALKREFLEEVGIEIKDFKLYDTDSVSLEWKYNEDIINVHHIGIFYNVLSYENEIKSNIEIDSVNDDSLGAAFYKINELSKKNLSNLAILLLDKMGYDLND